MLNIPGTMLFVRKRSFSKQARWEDHGIWWTFNEKKSPSARGLTDSVYLPFGACVILMSLEEHEPPAFGHGKKYTMTCLYGKKILIGRLSRSQLNNWFAYAGKWEKRYKQEYVKMLEKYDVNPNDFKM